MARPAAAGSSRLASRAHGAARAARAPAPAARRARERRRGVPQALRPRTPSRARGGEAGARPPGSAARVAGADLPPRARRGGARAPRARRAGGRRLRDRDALRRGAHAQADARRAADGAPPAAPRRGRSDRGPARLRLDTRRSPPRQPAGRRGEGLARRPAGGPAPARGLGSLARPGRARPLARRLALAGRARTPAGPSARPLAAVRPPCAAKPALGGTRIGRPRAGLRAQPHAPRAAARPPLRKLAGGTLRRASLAAHRRGSPAARPSKPTGPRSRRAARA